MSTMRIKEYICSFPLKAYFARANPPIVQKKTVVLVDRTAMRILCMKFKPNGIDVLRIFQFSNSEIPGSKGGGTLYIVVIL